MGIKTNVFNFEIFTTLAVQLPPESDLALKSESWIVAPENVSDIQNHPLLNTFFSLIQGVLPVEFYNNPINAAKNEQYI